MNFFEDFGKTLSGRGKEAVNKAKGLTDVLKLKAQLSSEKTKLNETFQAIGKKYYETYKTEGPAEEFVTEFLAAEAAQNRISALEDEICEMEGCRTCPECGAKLSREDAFCSKCGAKMPVKPSEAETIIVDEDDEAEETCETCEDICEEAAEEVCEKAQEACEEAAEEICEKAQEVCETCEEAAEEICEKAEEACEICEESCEKKSEE
ncbi:MAG: zinc ribbon domain-containing protein [bacterium]|nr:zinc ribbon domain-containing protein [bacterium]